MVLAVPVGLLLIVVVCGKSELERIARTCFHDAQIGVRGPEIGNP